jgi:photosystem II stability/assembly factor-like uncharacterized protein
MKRRIGVLVLSAVPLLLAVSGQARTRVWRQSHLRYDDEVWSLAADPKKPGVVYVTDDSGLYKTSDGGRSWKTLVQLVPGRAVAVAPSDPQTVYFGGNPGGSTTCISKSTNGGRKWRVLGCGNDGEVRVITVDPRDSQTFYVGSVDGDVIDKTTDGGQHWRIINRGLPKKADLDALVIDPKDTQVLYAAVAGLGFKSTNGGRSWQALPTGGVGKVRTFAVDLHRPPSTKAWTNMSS